MNPPVLQGHPVSKRRGEARPQGLPPQNVRGMAETFHGGSSSTDTLGAQNRQVCSQTGGRCGGHGYAEERKLSG